MPKHRPVFVWSWRIRLFHWLLVSSIVLLWFSSDEAWMLPHSILGYGVAVLLMLRVWLGVAGNGYERFSAAFGPAALMFKNPLLAAKATSLADAGHPPASAVTLAALLGLLPVIILSGIAAQGAMELEGPMASLLLDLDKHQARTLLQAHQRLTDVLFILIFAHIAGVLVDHFIHKTGVIKGMITGYKEQIDG